jgi:hypothetical protein
VPEVRADDGGEALLGAQGAQLDNTCKAICKSALVPVQRLEPESAGSTATDYAERA